MENGLASLRTGYAAHESLVGLEYLSFLLLELTVSQLYRSLRSCASRRTLQYLINIQHNERLLSWHIPFQFHNNIYPG